MSLSLFVSVDVSSPDIEHECSRFWRVICRLSPEYEQALLEQNLCMLMSAVGATDNTPCLDKAASGLRVCI